MRCRPQLLLVLPQNRGGEGRKFVGSAAAVLACSIAAPAVAVAGAPPRRYRRREGGEELEQRPRRRRSFCIFCLPLLDNPCRIGVVAASATPGCCCPISLLPLLLLHITDVPAAVLHC
ncbi:hypothetical protein PIB30_096560 [Stylosanthes scabra]|uniref:Uncharacterized protein n=1 Tax=Stylosanthes scabra TaxID=79078 RepID=A0ABU6ZUT6_9FABA|nr:hypothetical protein [Stylosanthes scabra]